MKAKSSRLGIFSCIFIIVLFLCISGFGASEVGPDGSFSYTIPLNLPPATGAMGPELSLVYNSESGNGLVGMGWNIQGYDIISRDNRYPINFTDTGTGADHFMYMGQRLFKESSSYIFHTESESYLKIELCAGGASGNGHYWKVTDKNGVIRYYGSRLSYAAIQNGGGFIYSHTSSSSDAARVWALDKVEDVYGNYYIIDYMQNSGQLNLDGSSDGRYGWYPSRIIYTLNNKSNSSFGRYRVVEFNYIGRPDDMTDSKPTPVANIMLLSSIKVYTNAVFDATWAMTSATLHHTYRLSYYDFNVDNIYDENNDATVETCNRSMLKTFQEWSGDGGLSRQPLTFTYTPNHAVNITNTGNRSMIFSKNNATLAKTTIISNADFDGDGKDDIMNYMGQMNDTYMIRIIPSRPGSDNGGFSETNSRCYNGGNNWKVSEVGPDKVNSVILFGDFNGDGKMDFMTYQGEKYSRDQRWIVFLSVSQSMYPDFTSSLVNFGDIGYRANGVCDPNLFRVCDVNGDGKADLVSLTKQNVTFADGGGNGPADGHADWRIFFAKADGTGFDGANPRVFTPPYTSRSFNWLSFDPSYFFTGDFNGDGCSDFLVYYKTEVDQFRDDHWSLMVSQCNMIPIITPFVEIQQPYFGNRERTGLVPEGEPRANPHVYFHDFTGDGRIDVLSHVVYQGGDPNPLAKSKWKLFVMNPVTNQFPAQANVQEFSTPDIVNIMPNLFGDFNGDGMTDFLICNKIEKDNLGLNDQLHTTVFFATGATMKESAFGANKFECFWAGGNGERDKNVAENIKLGDFDGNGTTDILFNVTKYPFPVLTRPLPTYYLWQIKMSSGNGGFVTNEGTRINIAENDPNIYSGLASDASYRNHEVVCLGNFFGDGKTSFFVNHNQHSPTYLTGNDFFELFRPASNTRANLLASIYNGQGGTTAISYTPAAAYVNPDGTSTVIDQSKTVINSKVPDTSIRNLVSDVTIHSGLLTEADGQNSSTNGTTEGSTHYTYWNGLYFPGTIPQRCLLGFEKIETKDAFTHCKTLTYYSQDKTTNHNPGSIINVETYGYFFNPDTNGEIHRILTKSETGYASRQVDANYYPEVYFVYKTWDKLTNYDGTGSNIEYKTDYWYDEYGNNTVILNHGNPSTVADDIQTNTYFAINKDKYVMKIWKTETLGCAADGFTWGLATQTIKYFDYQQTTFSGTNPQKTLDNIFSGINSVGAVTQIRSVAGGSDVDSITRFLYDSWGNCTEIMDARNKTTRKTYDPNYHMLVTDTCTEPGGLNLHTRYEYDAFMNNTSVTDENDVLVSRTYYNQLNDPERILGPFDTFDSPAVITTYDYAEKSVNENKFIIGNPRRVKTSTKAYKSGLPPNEVYTRFETYTYFNGLGQIAQKISSAPETSGSTWQMTAYIYDRAGRLVYEIVPRPEISTDYHYQNLTGFSKTKTEYDYAGRPVRTIYPDTTSTQTRYGLLYTGVIDRNGHYTETEVAGNVKIAKEFRGTDFSGSGSFTEYARTTTKEYRGGSTVTDANGNVTTTVLNMLGRTKQITSPDMGTWYFDYDVNGNKTLQTDARGNTIRYAYDNANRMVTIYYPDNTTTAFTYDQTDSDHGYGKGRLTTSTYTAGSISNKYDSAGRLVSQTTTIDGESRTETFAYSQTGSLETKTYPNNCGSAETLTYNYQSNGALNSVRSSLGSGFITSTSYNIRGQATTIIKGNGQQTNYSYYDELSTDPGTGTSCSYRVSRETSVFGAIYTYNYDRVGNLKKRTDESSVNGTASYDYDEMDRLTWANTTMYGSLSYGYDKVGNITSKDGYAYTYIAGSNRLNFDGQNYYQYDNNGNITAKSPNQNPITAQAKIGNSYFSTLQDAYIAATDGATIKATASVFSGNVTPGAQTASNVTFSGGWDASFGNVIGSSTLGGQIANAQKILAFQKFILSSKGASAGNTYDYNNMLIKSGTDTYAYFGERRVKKSENGVTTKYFFSDYEEETNGSVNYIKYYPGGAQRSTTDGLLYVYKDISGNTSVVTNEYGLPVKRLIYDPFGKFIMENPYLDIPGAYPNGAQKIKYRFAGGEEDSTGLNYFGARYYDPNIGRFITPDTIVPGGSPQCLNRYSYCGNNPINYADPSGHSFLGDTWDAVGDFVGGVMDISDFFTKPLLKFASMPLEEMGVKEIRFGGWIGLGGEVSINCETGDYSGDVGPGFGVKGGVTHKYADIGGDCSTHAGLGYNSADKSLFFKAGSAASMNGGYGGEVTFGYSFKNHVGYQSLSLTVGPASYGWSMYGSNVDFRAGLSFGGLSGSWSTSGGFSLGASLSDGNGNSTGVSYNVNNGKWRGSVGLEMCFVAGTKIQTIDGQKNIEEIETGDMVMSYNEETGEFGYKEVLGTIVTHPDKIVKVQVGDESIECTTEHPFFVIAGLKSENQLASYHEKMERVNGSWIEAGDLKPGMKLLGSGGSLVEITKVEIESRNETTYNFEVADWHTYCVGKQNVVVHNEGAGCDSWSSCSKKVLKAADEAVNNATQKLPYEARSCSNPFLCGLVAGFQLGQMINTLIFHPENFRFGNTESYVNDTSQPQYIPPAPGRSEEENNAILYSNGQGKVEIGEIEYFPGS
jgi:RHS repeat-associated protein